MHAACKLPFSTQRLPDCLALPWMEVAKHFGFSPVLNYAATVQFNWKIIDPAEDTNGVPSYRYKLHKHALCSVFVHGFSYVYA